MIPSASGFLDRDFEIEEQPSMTYRMDLEGGRVRGLADGREAVEQAVFRILSTERYRHIIYPWWYGVETQDLYGEPATYACPELERRIREALLTDGRIVSVDDFEFDLGAKGAVRASFTVRTVYGDVRAEKGVEI